MNKDGSKWEISKPPWVTALAKIRYSPEAKVDLVEIDAYIRNEFCNPTAAENTVKKILRTIAVLEDSPEIGTPLSAIVDIETNYRFLVSGAYLTFYRYVKGACEIDRVLYGRRDYMTILFKNDADEE